MLSSSEERPEWFAIWVNIYYSYMFSIQQRSVCSMGVIYFTYTPLLAAFIRHGTWTQALMSGPYMCSCVYQKIPRCIYITITQRGSPVYRNRAYWRLLNARQTRYCFIRAQKACTLSGVSIHSVAKTSKCRTRKHPSNFRAQVSQ